MALIENEKDLLVALQAEFGGRQFKFKRVLKTIHKHSDGFIHSTKIFAMLRRLVEDGKLNEIERMKYKILPVEGKAMKDVKMTKMTRVKVKNRTAKRITASVSNVFAKKTEKPKKKTPAVKEVGRVEKQVDKLAASMKKVGKELSTVKKVLTIIRKDPTAKTGKLARKLDKLAKQLHKVLTATEGLIEKSS